MGINSFNQEKPNIVKQRLLLIATLVLSSFWIYLGRVLRLNSWDFFTDFWHTVTQIVSHLFPVNKNPVTYLMIILFTIIQSLLFVLMKGINQKTD